jgi:hypothetical protein
MLKWTRSSWQVIILAAALLCWLAPSALAQVATGTFTGIVSDPTGAVIPGAKVTATNEGTGVATERKTNTEGIFTIPELIPGFYTVKAEAQGFKTYVNTHIELTVGYTQRVSFKLEVGTMTQSVTVEGQAPQVDTESNRMSDLVTAQQVENLPLNGRNIFQMIQLAPGAVNATAIDTEPGNRGFQTVVNGARVNMNGYQIDGIVDKGLSGGSDTQPAVDSVQEFRVDTEVLSAEYGSTVGALTQISTKAGTNQFHGDAYEFDRNDKLNARNFFDPPTRPPFKMNQFGATIGGPIKKDKLFFFASYEGERSRIFVPEEEFMETPAFANLVETYAPNSVAALLYKNFPGPTPPASTTQTLTTYLTQSSVFGPCYGLSQITAGCISGYGLDPTTGLGAALLASGNMATYGPVDAAALVETYNQFYDGNQFSGRIDYSGDKNKVFGSYFFDHYADPHYTPAANGGSATALVGLRGFASPETNSDPHVALNWVRTISPNMVNEMRAGWVRDIQDFGANDPGVPEIVFPITAEVDFGNYSGYPQIFHEEEFQYADLVTISHGKHTMKMGGSIQRNYENSEFNVGRPSIDFLDSVGFAAGMPISEAAGVSPGTVDVATGVSEGGAHLASNIRAWRNWEFGAFFNDTYKVSPRLTLTLGLRYDLYSRHTEKYHQGTLFILPPGGSNLTARLEAINCFENIPGDTGDDGQPCDGGFEATNGAIAPGDHHDLGPRVGFAYDVFGDGKTSLRGGFGISYNGEIYNPISNSRWQPPFYSFNIASCSTVNTPGAASTNTCIFGPTNGATPTYTGPPSNVGAGPASASFGAFAGNIQGWNPYNANAAFLTGIVLPNDFPDPYVYGSQLSLEHQFAGNFVLRTSWVGTFGHKLIRAEDINRYFNSVNQSTGCPGTGFANCLFGYLRTWENSINSNYNALQVVLDKKMSKNLEIHSNYEWSHSLDARSSWHDFATTSNGASEGYSEDQEYPNLDYGASLFDVRHRFSLSAVYSLPWMAGQKGFAGHLLGGWQANTILQFHGGFPWTPYCYKYTGEQSCDFNLDGDSNDRPNAPAFGNHAANTSNASFEPNHPNLNLNPDAFFCNPSDFIAGCSEPNTTPGFVPFDGNLGRDTFRGPHFGEVDLSLFKSIKVTERVNFQFRAEGFNIFNHTNLYQPGNQFTSPSTFGQAQQAYFPRQIQFALKMMF